MGAVHGVYLKYVGLSAISLAGYHMIVGNIGPLDPLPSGMSLLAGSDGHRMLATSSSEGGNPAWNIMPLLRLGTATVLSYSALLNGAIAVLFKLRKGMSLIGKDLKMGTIPWWSYLLFFPFHIPTIAYTAVHTKCGRMKHYIKAEDSHDGSTTKQKVSKVPVPVASQVQPGWWIGGCYAYQLNIQWAAVIDLTVEFPEKCRSSTQRYLCLPTWDGVPASPEQLEKAAVFCMEAIENWKQLQENGEVKGEPQILIHCAHGRGRSTTVACAAMVKMGMFSDWEEALEVGIRPRRPVCKLNAMMRKNLTEWQRKYV